MQLQHATHYDHLKSFVVSLMKCPHFIILFFASLTIMCCSQHRMDATEGVGLRVVVWSGGARGGVA